MKERMNIRTAAPEALKPLLALQRYTNECGLEPSLLELVKIRASQINGCAFCLEMHTREAHAMGESHVRMHLLAGWRESPLFSPRERAALAWTEALTRLADSHAPDDVYEAARAQFDEKELANLSVAIGMINVWNRLQVGFRALHPVQKAAAE
jgi:AhpD family alkylhydroperoxidase